MSHSHIIPSASKAFQREFIELFRNGTCNFEHMDEALCKVAALHNIARYDFWRNASLVVSSLSVGLIQPTPATMKVVGTIEKQLRALATGTLPSDEASVAVNELAAFCLSAAHRSVCDIEVTELVGSSIVKAKALLEEAYEGSVDAAEFGRAMQHVSTLGNGVLKRACENASSLFSAQDYDRCALSLIAIERIIASDALTAHSMMLVDASMVDEKSFSKIYRFCSLLDAEKNLTRALKANPDSEPHLGASKVVFGGDILVPKEVTSAEMEMFGTASILDAVADVEADDDLIIDSSGEMTDLFVEEAMEVVEGIKEAISRFRSLGADDKQDIKEAITDMRLGFHTLKGSSRVVGQDRVGESAWLVEKTFNDHIDSCAKTHPEMVTAASDIAEQFAEWLAGMAKDDRRPDEVYEKAIEEGVARFKAGKMPAQESTGTIKRRASQAVINLAKTEVIQHADTLLSLLGSEVITGNNPPLPEEFLRAAHTLHGVFGTIHQYELEAIAAELEAFCNRTEWVHFHLRDEDHQLMLDAINYMKSIDVEQFETFAIIKDAGEFASKLKAIEILPLPKESVLDNEGSPLVATEMPGQAAQDIPDDISVVTASGNPAEDAGLAFAAPVTPVVPGGEDGIEIESLLEQEFLLNTDVAAESVVREVEDDIDTQMLRSFMAEMDEYRPVISREIAAWKNSNGGREHHDEIYRLIHTLKGNARMAGAMRIGEIAHRLEDGLNASVYIKDKTAIMSEVESGFDDICRLVDELNSGDFTSGIDNVERTRTRSLSGRYLRISAATLEKVISNAGEMDFLHATEAVLLPKLVNSVTDLQRTHAKMKQKLREIEIQLESSMQSRLSDGDENFDPLEFDRFTTAQEMIRSITETMFDAEAFSSSIVEAAESVVTASERMGKVHKMQNHELVGIRMSSFAEIEDRLHRVVRQVAKECGKKVNLDISGGSLPIDHDVIEGLVTPIEHMLRNSIVHGIESDRAAAGKEQMGNIWLNISVTAKSVAVRVSDDGGGIDIGKLQEKAMSMGVALDKGVNPEQLIFEQGLSTANKLTENAGRGIGMDIVRTFVRNLGGDISITETNSSGTVFDISVPVHTSLMSVLVIKSGDEIYALPASIVSTIKKVEAADMPKVMQDSAVEWQGRNYPVHFVSSVMHSGTTTRSEENGMTFAILKNIALQLDDVVGIREVVAHPPGAHLSSIEGIYGLSTIGDARSVLIINPELFIDAKDGSVVRTSTTKIVNSIRENPLVMIVDDSLTLRRVTSNFLVQNGYEVATASDGLDALSRMDAVQPDVMLLDIEMPRMDGFELLKSLRQSERYQSLPIIMISSRTAEKHRQHAASLGVTDFLGKPFKGGLLLEALKKFTNSRFQNNQSRSMQDE